MRLAKKNWMETCWLHGDAEAAVLNGATRNFAQQFAVIVRRFLLALNPEGHRANC